MSHDHHDPPYSLLPPEPEVRVKALETILTEKSLIDPAAVQLIIDSYQNKIGPRIGARLVARAWTDAAFRDRLLNDTAGVLAESDLAGRQGEHVVVVENTPETHNLVVCTLCSCYPWPLLGIPPGWYKPDNYRRRAVSQPRTVLAEFGLQLPPTTQVRVWDSTAEIRYLVLPQCPEQAQSLSVDEASRWITRDSMIGTGLPIRPTDSLDRG